MRVWTSPSNPGEGAMSSQRAGLMAKYLQVIAAYICQNQIIPSINNATINQI